MALFAANSLVFKINPVMADWRFVGFFVGIGLAMLRGDPRGRALFEKVPPGFQTFGLAVLVLGCWLWSRDFTGTLSALSPALALAYFAAFDLAVALTVAALVNAAARTGPGGAGGGLFAWTPLRAVGAVSYSLFLLHTQWGLPLANTLFGRPSGPLGLGLHYAASLGLSFAMATLLYVHLERFYFTRTKP